MIMESERIRWIDKRYSMKELKNIITALDERVKALELWKGLDK